MLNISNIKSKSPLKSHTSVTNPTTISDSIERYLSNIFENEMAQPGSILVSYNPFVIKKIAGYLSGKIKMPASIGIAGETAGREIVELCAKQ